MISFEGTPVSSGIAVGRVWKYELPTLSFERHKISDPGKEWDRFQSSINTVKKQLQSIQERAKKRFGSEEAEIFEAHQLVLEDPEFLGKIRDSIYVDHHNAEAAVSDSVNEFKNMMEQLEDEYFQARSQDIQDVGERIINVLLGKDVDDFVFPEKPVILLAGDLMPSDTVNFDRDKILALCTVRGSPTSHAAILARSLGVPALVRVKLPLEEVENDTEAIVDGTKGVFILEPTEEELVSYKRKHINWLHEQATRIEAAKGITYTLDGHRVEVVANIGSIQDAHQAVESGAEGIGLLRTEFLYLDRRSMPSEERQVEIYRQIFDVFSAKPVVVRTLDIGGDKVVDYLGVTNETNPFLGWRGIRMIRGRPGVLVNQFRAILQAGVDVDLRVMMPMVSRIVEVEQGRALYEQARQNLLDEGRAIPKKVQFGIMVEVPSVALMAEQFIEKVDFFSIGTNDLAQYTLAVDRTNDRVSDLASPLEPSVLKLIARTIKIAHSAGKWVGLCGEMAGDPLAVPLLVGLRLDEFSMAPSVIPIIKQIIRQCSADECESIAEVVLKLPTREEVIAYLKEKTPDFSLI